MYIRPILICAAGVLALQLLAVRADTTISLEIPKGWSASDSIGKQYFLGYDSREKAYFLNNMEPIGPAGRLINADTVPSPGGHHVPYSTSGLKATDAWSASLLQSVKAAPYRGRKLRFEAEIKSSGFKGAICLLLRADDPGEGGESNSSECVAPSGEWQSFAVEMEETPASDKSVLAFGFLRQGEGKVLIRNARLSDLPGAPNVPEEPKLWEMFDLPVANDEPVNVGMQR